MKKENKRKVENSLLSLMITSSRVFFAGGVILAGSISSLV